MEDYGDVPPLEDMTDTFNNCLKIREQRNQARNVNEILEVPDNEERIRTQRIEKLLGKEDEKVGKSNSELKKTVTENDNKNKSSNYCGFKKGFLTSSSKVNKSKKPVKKESEEITVVTKKVEEKNVLPEVQKAINESIPLLKSTDWVTEDLLTKITKNPKLAKQFTDPRFAKVIEEFQTNPEKIMRMAENNPEMREFIQDFCAIMGDHFTELGNQQESKGVKIAEQKTKGPRGVGTQQSTQDDEKKMKEILSDPEVNSILKTREIQMLFTLLKEDPQKARKMLNSADARLRQKIQKLIDVGLLQMAM